jgi:hypothetical protein
MPVATINEDRDAGFNKREIGSSGHSGQPAVDEEAKTANVNR